METPILFLIFNRPDTTRVVFEAIRKNKPKKLFIAADGPRINHKNDKVNCHEARKIVANVDWDCEIHTLFREENLGCKFAVSSAISWFFDNVDKGIIIEDDCHPNDSFFRFCNIMLDLYTHDEEVMMISGINHFEEPKSAKPDYFFSQHFQIWGWATWKRAWSKYDISMSKWPHMSKENELKRIISNDKISRYYKDIFDSAYNNLIDTWDIQWAYTCLKNRGVSIVPTYNLVSNIGPNGTHSSSKPHLDTNLFRKTEEFSMYANFTKKVIEVNKELDFKLYKKFSSGSVIKKIYAKAVFLWISSTIIRQITSKIDLLYARTERKIRKILHLTEIPRYKTRRYANNNQFDYTDIASTTLAIIIPCFGHDRYLGKCLESILFQTEEPDEIIIVDDNSKDDTAKIVERFRINYGKKIKIIHNQKNIGQSESINLAVQQSDSDLIMILNDDDYLYPDAVKLVKSFFAQHPHISLVGSEATSITNDQDIYETVRELVPRYITADNIIIHKPKDVVGYDKSNDINMTHSSSTFTRQVWKKTGGYISKKSARIVNFSDRDFQIRVALITPIAVIKNIPLAFWRSNSSVDAGINS